MATNFSFIYSRTNYNINKHSLNLNDTSLFLKCFYCNFVVI